MAAEEIRAVLAAYKEVMLASWPSLNPTLVQKSQGWPTASEDTLQAELEGYLRESSQPGGRVRIFWKLGDRFLFAGCNQLFAKDAGQSGPAALLGIDDFNDKLPWARQAFKYRSDDEQVYRGGTPKLDIIERQDQVDGSHNWLRVGKTPIRTREGRVIGILGMYEILENEVGRRLYAERIKNAQPRAE
jgi:hypothetical protein